MSKKESFLAGEYLTSKEVASFLSCSVKTARDRLLVIRRNLGKPKGAPISVEEFSTAEGFHSDFIRLYKIHSGLEDSIAGSGGKQKESNSCNIKLL